MDEITEEKAMELFDKNESVRFMVEPARENPKAIKIAEVILKMIPWELPSSKEEAKQ